MSAERWKTPVSYHSVDGSGSRKTPVSYLSVDGSGSRKTPGASG